MTLPIFRTYLTARHTALLLSTEAKGKSERVIDMAIPRFFCT